MTQVLILMGSVSDKPVMEKAQEVLNEFGVKWETKVCSAHRSPDYLHQLMQEYKDAKVFIAGAGLAAHLAGVVCSLTVRPVIGVPLAAGPLNGVDALLSTAQMPPGMPVATMGIDNARNAAMFAVQILALQDAELERKLLTFREKTQQNIIDKNK
ncbi:5-(carboxyamino)imidazole ribonucleotide mutase [Elusimicrobium simillimum]|uniref:5-(carboxyamino)imidazole ribonucleotide mutase n=1 Tax=Elusimicrobium simillimum TaxID=3143438 RepID=UPI003C705BA2